MDGATTIASLDALDDAPDAAYIAVRKELTVDAVQKLAALGAGGVVCHAAGFSETGPSGRSLQAQLTAVAGDLALLGPNCYGYENLLDGVSLWAGSHFLSRVERGVALISQSGALVETMTFGQRSLPIAYSISVGNQAVLGVEDLLEYVLGDTRVSGVGIYVESLRDVAKFKLTARCALEQAVPIIAIKSGASAVGQRIAVGHTASLSAPDRLYDALFDELGIIRVNSVEGLIETAKFLTFTGVPRGRKLGLYACSGGDIGMSADLGSSLGLEFPTLSETHTARLKSVLPEFATPANPLDYTLGAWGNVDTHQVMAEVLSSDPVDVLAMCTEFPEVATPWLEGTRIALDAIIESRRKTGKPTAVITHLPEDQIPELCTALAQAGVAPMQGHRNAFEAIARAAWYGERRRDALAQAVTDEETRNPDIPEGGEEALTEWASKTILSAAGMRVPVGAVGAFDELSAIADQIGYPLVLKAAGGVIAHKTDVGAVQVGIRDEARLLEAAHTMHARLGELASRFLVEAMAPEPVAELVVGFARDPQFGPFLVIGSGGILVELLDDTQTLLLPTTAHRIGLALSRLRAHRLLIGFRGRPPGDIEALVTGLQRLSEHVWDNQHRVLALEINPLFVLTHGNGVIAVDALVTQRPEEVSNK